MRRDGKTTREIDFAIQQLFKNNELVVPISSLYKAEDLMGLFPRGVYTGHVAVDPDFYEGIAQRNFADRLLRRLKFEHEGSYISKQYKTFYLIKTTGFKVNKS